MSSSFPRSRPPLPRRPRRSRSLRSHPTGIVTDSNRRTFGGSSPQAIARLDRARWKRLALVWLVLMVGVVVLGLNLVKIQVFQAPMLQARAKDQQMVALNASAPRRMIVDRAGGVLAIDQPVYTLYAHPSMFSKPSSEVAAALFPILKTPVADLIKRFGEGKTGLRIVDGLTSDAAKQITALRIDGLELDQQQQRMYPQQELFANIVGYVNLDRQGQAGVELSEESRLQRPSESMELNRSGDGSIIPINLPKDFLQKDELRLQLTVDSRLQRTTHFALKQWVEKYSAKRGTAMVMDVQDGSILAMVSEPSYDANKYYDAKAESLRNWPISDLYEPGSTFKPLNVAIALESGAVQPNDIFYDEGAIEVDGWPIQNNDFSSVGGRGNLTVSQILQHSSNVGMVHIMHQLQAGVYYGWLQRLGLDKPTGIELPSEAVGQMKDYAQFTESNIEPATTAFGQGFSLTPIKLLQLHGMLANGGKMITPHLVQGLSSPDGTLKWRPTFAEPTIFSPTTAHTVLEMMESVVQEGTGSPANIPGYRIAGKTGTAQKADPNGGYIDGARITSFVGVLPVDHPRYVVLAVVDEPQGENAYGSTVAAPIVKSVMETLITTEQIPPGQPETMQRLDLSQEQTDKGEPWYQPEHPADAQTDTQTEPAVDRPESSDQSEQLEQSEPADSPRP